MTSSIHYFYVFCAWQENLNNQNNPIPLTRTWKLFWITFIKSANFSVLYDFGTIKHNVISIIIWYQTVLIYMLFMCLSFNCLKCLCISDPAREFFAWLEKAFSPNCVPPNVELTPDAIRDGEVLLTNVSHTASITYPRFPTRSIHRHWLPCYTS